MKLLSLVRQIFKAIEPHEKLTIEKLDSKLKLASFENITFFPLSKVGGGRPVLEVCGDIDLKLLEHHRFYKKASLSMVDVRTSSNTNKGGEVLDQAIFAGYLFSEYGHFLAESIHRLWPLLTDPELKNLPILFFPFRGKRSQNYKKKFMHDVFEHLGIDINRVRIIQQPVNIKKLLVPTQVKWLMGPPMPTEYSKIFEPFIPVEPCAGYKNIYVSRSRFGSSGRYVGEPLVDEILQGAGVHVIYPENHSISELISIYTNADNIAFSEGSSIHVLELCGHIKAKVMIVCRRPKEMGERRFRAASELVNGGLAYFDIQTALPTLQTSKRGAPYEARNMALLDTPALFMTLREFFGL